MTIREPLTAEQIDTVPAGREMDALVAERVMGWKNLHWVEGGKKDNASWPTGWYGDGPENEVYLYKNYSTDIAAAWEVVKNLIERKYEWQMEMERYGERVIFECHICDTQHGGWSGESQWYERLSDAKGDSAPLAICRAALRSVLTGEK